MYVGSPGKPLAMLGGAKQLAKTLKPSKEGGWQHKSSSSDQEIAREEDENRKDESTLQLW